MPVRSVPAQVGVVGAAQVAPASFPFGPTAGVPEAMGGPRPGVGQAVAKRPGSPIAPPNNVLRTIRGSHEMFL